MSEWISNSLGELVSFQKGKKVITSPFLLNGYEPYLGAGALSGEHDGYALSSFAIRAGVDDILMLWDGERSGLCSSGLNGVVSSTVCKLTPKNNISGSFLYYFLLSKFDWIQSRRTGTGVPHVPKDLGRILDVKHPKSLKEQEEIAAILKIVDKVIEHTNCLIKKHQKVKIGMMYDLFTRGVSIDGSLRPRYEQNPELYKETDLGFLPREWIISPLRDVLMRIDSGWSPACYEIPPGNGEWGVLKVSAVTKGYYDFSESKTLPMWLRPIPSMEVKDGDVIMTRANGVAELVGKCVQVSETQDKLMLSDKLLRLVPNEKISKDYLCLLICSHHITKQIASVMNGSSGQRNISQSEIKNFHCVIPPLNEQERISTLLLAYNKSINREKKTLEKLIKVKYGLMDDLLTGKVSVQSKQKETEAPHV
ncbi:restriction endonuclease subunit S [Pantoea stewartii]|uniref:restriction endonuclease subunit S n=1 Tax=Pantoea stewartii TaxID=66269 RepID=UPI00197D4EAD|nr:restriction endonuclease subunit S [Pantoea stewartii]